MLKLHHLQFNTLTRSGDYHYTGSQDASASTTDFVLADGVLYEVEITVLGTIQRTGCQHYASTAYSGNTDGFDTNTSQQSLGTVKAYVRRSGATLYAGLHPDFVTLSAVSSNVYTQVTQRNIEVSAGVFKNLDWTGVAAIAAGASPLGSAITFSLDGSNQLVIDMNDTFADTGSIAIGTADGYQFVLEGGAGGGSLQFNHTDGYSAAPDAAYAISTCQLSCNWNFGLRVAIIE
jgi:hypothetical protein